MLPADSGNAHPLPCVLKHAQPIIDIQLKPIIWILGGPGCGKGTQCQLLMQKYGFAHISTGDLLRTEIKTGSDRALYLESYMDQGKLDPSNIVLDLLKDEMMKYAPTSRGFLIDGYPRNIDQALEFEDVMAPVTMIIFLEMSTETMMQRLRHRAATAQAENQRRDDTEEIFQMRIHNFLHETDPILKHYSDKLRAVNAEGSVQKVFAAIQPIMDRMK